MDRDSPSRTATDGRPPPPPGWPNGRRDVVRIFPGAVLHRTSDPGGRCVPEHAHDWPLLSLFIAGGYRNVVDEGALTIAGPSAVFYRRGDAHANQIGRFGHEQLEIEFDPAWLGAGALAQPDRPVRRIGGAVALASRRLLKLCQDPAATERGIAQALRSFLAHMATPDAAPAAPAWLVQVESLLGTTPRPLDNADLADRLGLSPPWLTETYRAHAGEGLAEADRRRRAQQAVHLLRTTAVPVAQIAAATGFCDQSHLARVVKRFYGCPPTRLDPAHRPE